MALRTRYERILPCIGMDQSLYLADQDLMVRVGQVDEPCEVLVRLCDRSGRIYAEALRSIQRPGEDINLGQAANLPAGQYHVLVTPPLAQFHSDVPLQRRMPVSVASAPLSNVLYGTQTDRSRELLLLVAKQVGIIGILARLALGQNTERDLIALQSRLADQPDAELVFAAAGLGVHAGQNSVATTLTRELNQLGNSEGLIGAMARSVLGDHEGLADEIREVGLNTASLARPFCIMAGLAAIALQSTADEIGGLVEALLDRLTLDLALLSDHGHLALADETPLDSRLSPSSAAARLLWGVGSFGGVSPGILVLAHSGYEPPEFLQAVALGPCSQGTLQGAEATTSLRFANGFTMCRSGHHTQLRLRGDILLSGRAEATGWTEQGFVAGGACPQLGWHALDRLETREDQLFGQVGGHYLSLRSDQPLRCVQNATGSGQELASEGTCWAVYTGDAVTHGSFDAFCQQQLASRQPLVMPPANMVDLPAPSLDAEAPGINGITVERRGTSLFIGYQSHIMELDFS